MNLKILGGAALAAAAVSLAISGATLAQAKHRHAAKPAAEKHNCGGKNGCPGMSKSGDKPAEPAKSDAAKSDAAAPAESKPADGK